MIRLCVQDYCQECRAFEPAAFECVTRNADGDDEKVIEVRCERWEMCANVARRTRKMTVDRVRADVERVKDAVIEIRRA